MENAHPIPRDEAGALNSTDSKSSAPRSPRLTRVLRALLATSGWLSREAVDRIAGASNGPQVILSLRQGYVGRDGIETGYQTAIDRDGKPCRPGRYRITAKGRERAAHFLRGTA
jgi:hypothetical protein